MFSRALRLPARVRMHTRMQITPLFTYKIQPNTLSHNRYGFVVSKAIDKRAVVRNRTKRRLRALIEKLHPLLPQGNDMLFVLKKEAVAKTTKELAVVLQEALEKKK